MGVNGFYIKIPVNQGYYFTLIMSIMRDSIFQPLGKSTRWFVITVKLYTIEISIIKLKNTLRQAKHESILFSQSIRLQTRTYTKKQQQFTTDKIAVSANPFSFPHQRLHVYVHRLFLLVAVAIISSSVATLPVFHYDCRLKGMTIFLVIASGARNTCIE